MAQLRCNKCGRLVEVSEETLALEECEFCATPEKLQGGTVCFDPCEQETDSTIKPLLGRVFLFLEDEEWEKADEYCEKVLDLDHQNAMAYLGKLMVEFQIPRIEDLTKTPKFYDRSKNYQKLFRFAKPELCERLNEIIAIKKTINKRLVLLVSGIVLVSILLTIFVFYPLISVWTGNYKAYIKMYNVKEFSVPNGVTTIDSSAFEGCTSLTSITIPEGVTSIGEGAFQGCDSLTSITLPVVDAGKDGTSNTLLGYIFGDSSYSNIASYVPNSLKTVIITGGTYIADYAFYNCANLMSITIPESVTSVGKCAFYGCTSLTSITIPKSVTTIGEGAFSNCDSLTSITIPESVTAIGDWAFSYCDSLTSITIPESVTSIGDYAFYGCNSLTRMTRIKYRGTESQWSQVSKGYYWDWMTGSYTITYGYKGE